MAQKKHQYPSWLRMAVKLMGNFHSPTIPAEPKPGKWYRVPMDRYVVADGTPYHFSFRKGTENKLMVFLHGGGVSWNTYMAARPFRIDAEDMRDCYYSAKAEDYGVLGSHGILSSRDCNPFRNWNIISLPYCTGDCHCGTAEFPYIALDESRQILHHHGYTNLTAAIRKAMTWTGSTPERLLVTGNSAGGFGAALVTDTVMGLFPDCQDVTCFVDSGLLYMDGWQEIARDVWKAPAEIWQRFHSGCFTVDCLEALKAEHKQRVRVLLTCSVRDFNLSQLIGFTQTGKLYADENTGKEFQQQLKLACERIINHIPGGAVYLFDTPVADKEGSRLKLTRHCVIPDDVSFTIRIEDTTVIQWLVDAMNGKPRNIGLNLL